MSPLSQLQQKISEALSKDRHPLRQQWKRLKSAQSKDQPFDQMQERLEKRLQESLELKQKRLDNQPKPSLDADLPVIERKEEIAETIRNHQVVIISGETGSGKSTQLPQICLEMGRGIDGVIGHTQPRRIAARSIASRITEELKGTPGKEVGYKIRFTDQTSPETYIKLMTDGILLAEIQSDRFLAQYDTLIIDEAHERSLNIDFLMGLLKQLLPKRPDLKVIITSATIDAERFSEFFTTNGEPAPVIQVSGRTYPVDVWYRPPVTEEEKGEADLMQAVCDAVDEISLRDMGDILIFLPTERDIRELATLLRGRLQSGGYESRKTEVLPLYARLSNAEQNKVFNPGSARRIVLATNVAESSLTVPGIHYVIDTGLARISRFSARSKIQRLPIEPISQASANQRKGRCGRVGPGICVRIYSEADFNSREEFTTPEIQRSNLASVILQTQMHRFGNLESFPFLDPPKPTVIRTGYKTLFELGALDDQNRLTETGKQLAKLPTDPRIGRMILSAEAENCLHEMMIIAAALEIQDPRERPVDKTQAADQAHAQFKDEHSDFMGYLKMWDIYHQWKEELSRNQLRKKCKKEFLSYNRMREWSETFRQISELVRGLGFKKRDRKDDETAIHRALLTGLLSNIATLNTEKKNEYKGAGGHPLFLWPGSVLFSAKPKWMMAAELVETTKRYARTIARIDPNWLEGMAPHLVKRSYGLPYWSAKRSTAMVDERVTLYGLVIVSRRPVNLGKIKPDEARQYFIQYGLVEGELECNAKFLKHNQSVFQEAEAIQHKLRRYDMLADQKTLFEFYDRHLPPDIFDVPRLNRWLKKVEPKNPTVLQISLEDLLQAPVTPEADEAFPSHLVVGQNRLPLEYKLAPGEQDDGMTLTIPQAAVNQLDQRRLGWLVPGLLEEKVVALIKSLPKSLRRLFVPVPDTAKEVMEKLNFGEGDLLESLALALRKLSGEHVSPSDFDESRLPGHLRITLKVVDNKSELIEQSDDLDQIRREVGSNPSSVALEQTDQRWQQTGLKSWSFGDLPRSLEITQQGMQLKAFPALIDEGETVGVTLTDTLEKAEYSHRRGALRLFLLDHHKTLRNHAENFPQVDQLQLLAASIPGLNFRKQLEVLIAERAFYTKNELPFTEQEFNAQSKFARNQITVVVQDLVSMLPPVMEQYHETMMMIERSQVPKLEPILQDTRSQLANLIHPEMLTRTPWNWLRHYPRFLNGIQHRIQKAQQGNYQKDLQGLRQIIPIWDQCLKRKAEHAQQGILDPQLEHYRWMIEEFRISLFAQQLGTSMTVSAKRLEKQWKKVRS